MKRIAIAAVMSIALAGGARAQGGSAPMGSLILYAAFVGAKECGYKMDWPRVRVYARRVGIDPNDMFKGLSKDDMREHANLVHRKHRQDRAKACADALKQFGPENVGEPMWEPLYAVD